jgi:thiosulfate dehydrogenase
MHRMVHIVAAFALLACRVDKPEAGGPAQAGRPTGGSFDAASWRAPADSEIPVDSLGAAIRRGLALLTHTPDSLPAFAPGEISCTNCHLDGGRNAASAPLTGAYVRYPRYLERSGAVVGIADRVNYCFTRSLAGSRLPDDSREMQDIVAYLAWLSRGVPLGEGGRLPGGEGLLAMPAHLTGDRVRGAEVYAKFCAACHQPNGEGSRALNPRVPALWGARSFSVGASMTRPSKSASFIWHNMPLGAGRSLTPQQAFDVAAYISSQPRPDSPGKERDWPNGGAPSDVPYATAGRAVQQSPPLLRRSHPERALVPPPRVVSRQRP